MRRWKIMIPVAIAAGLVIAIGSGRVDSPIKFVSAEEIAAKRPQSRMEILHNEHVVYGSGLKSMDDQLTIMRDRVNGNLCYVFLQKMACIEQSRPVEQHP